MRMYPIWRPGYTFHYQSFQVSRDVHTVNLNIWSLSPLDKWGLVGNIVYKLYSDSKKLIFGL